jgi:hypothetical protein
MPGTASLVLSLSLGLAAASAQPATPQPFPTPASGSRPSSTTPAPATSTPPGPGGRTTTAAPASAGTTTATPATATTTATPPPQQRAAQPPSSAAPAPAVAPTEAALGLPIYPEAQFLASYNAGQGQRYYLFGTAASFAQVTAFYRGALKLKGDIVFDEPQTVMFEVGRYREETMAFPPGVTVKDYTWGDIGGYLNPKRGTQPERFPTVIQIVPATSGAPE